MADELVMLTKNAATRTKACVLAFEQASNNRPSSPGGHARNDRPPIRAILLEDLVNEGVADCVVTVKVSSPAIQKLTIYGYVSAGTFTLGFKGQSTAAMAYNATPAVVQAALEKLKTIGPGNVRVTVGTIEISDNPADDIFPGVWLIEFIGMFLSRDPLSIPLIEPTSSLGSTGPSLIVDETTEWADTGVIEQVHATIPVGRPTPMRAGAVITAVQWPGMGYGILTCEPRLFGAPY